MDRFIRIECFVFMLFCDRMKRILYRMDWELCLDPV
uniref:Ycf3 n=1 Tax=Arundo donax TaxID=35708 RepID=A0A0A9FV24_ARUDO